MPLTQATTSYRNQVVTWTANNGTITRSISNWGARYVSDNKPDRIRSRKGSGWLMPKPYTRSHLERVEPHGLHIATNVSGYRSIRREGAMQAQVGTPAVSLSGIPQRLVGQAELEAMLMVKDQKANLPVTVAEFGKTIQMVTQTATRLAKTITALRKGRLAEASRHLGVGFGRKYRGRDPRDVWLEHRYGWMPLLGDIKGQLDLLTSLDESTWMLTGIGKAGDFVRSQVDNSDGAREYPVLTTSVINYLCKCRLDFLPRNYNDAILRMAGCTNPFSVAWELLPFSFVADWFVPVGDSLSALDYCHGLTFKSGSLTKFARGVQSFEAGRNPPPYVTTWKVVASANGFDLERTTYNSAPLPFRVPQPRMPTSIKQMLDSISLLKGATSRVLRT